MPSRSGLRADLTADRDDRPSIAVLSGPRDDRMVPASVYRQLTIDLSTNGCSVIGDLSGRQLDAMLTGGPLLAGLAASLARGESLRAALRVGAACGALNVVRAGLGSGGGAAVAALAKRVELRGRRDGELS